MKKNVGSTDSMVRLSIAVIITLLYLFNIISTTVAMALLFVGILLFFTSITKSCPIYRVLGVSTAKGKTKA
jgi:hypothetical protein